MPCPSLEEGNETARVHHITAAWPRAARSQQPERMRRIVYMHALAENDPEEQLRTAALRQGLETLGWTENRNIQIEHRYSGGDFKNVVEKKREETLPWMAQAATTLSDGVRCE